MWRNEVAKDAEAVLREFPNGVPPTVYHQVALEISDCIPSPDGRNGLTEKMEIARLRMLAKRLSDALLTVAPLGGSECFTRSGDDFYADPEWFKVRIRDLHDRAHEGMKRAGRAERQASANEQDVSK